MLAWKSSDGAGKSPDSWNCSSASDAESSSAAGPLGPRTFFPESARDSAVLLTLAAFFISLPDGVAPFTPRELLVLTREEVLLLARDPSAPVLPLEGLPAAATFSLLPCLASRPPARPARSAMRLKLTAFLTAAPGLAALAREIRSEPLASALELLKRPTLLLSASDMTMG